MVDVEMGRTRDEFDVTNIWKSRVKSPHPSWTAITPSKLTAGTTTTARPCLTRLMFNPFPRRKDSAYSGLC